MPLDIIERSAFPAVSPAEPERRRAAAADIAGEAGQGQRAGQEKSGMDQHNAHMRPRHPRNRLKVKLYRGGDAAAGTWPLADW